MNGTRCGNHAATTLQQSSRNSHASADWDRPSICHELHKAATAEYHSHMFWFKHCRSNRKAVRISTIDNGSVKCYLGGCPRLLRCSELVITGESAELAATALVLPVILTDGRVRLRPEIWIGAANQVQQMQDHCATRRYCCRSMDNRVNQVFVYARRLSHEALPSLYMYICNH